MLDRGRDSTSVRAEDFGAELTPELREQEERLRKQSSGKKESHWA